MSRPRRSLVLLALASSAALLLHACTKSDPVKPPSGPVTGTITGAVTLAGSGLTGVTVSVSGPEARSTTTGTAGVYSFSELAKGSYAVTVSGYGPDATFAIKTQSASITTAGQTVTVSFAATLTAVASISVTPATASLTVGATQQLAATPKDAAGTTLTGRTVTWSSSSSAVATVNAGTGLATAVAAGTATITATIEGKTGTATITVSTGGAGAIGSDQFVLIQPGSFQMGSTNGSNDEKPVHAVTITKAFYLMKTEVTQAQWKSVMDTMPSHFSSCGLTCPVESVNWNDIQTFLSKLNAANPGANYRLPTEAEWEYAARAGTTGDYGGTGVLNDMGWYNTNSGSVTHTVAQKAANAWGLYDMHGNVFEWVQDWYSSSYYGASPASDPTGPATGTERVLRGGSFNYGSSQARSAYRWTAAPGDRVGIYGFRLARTPPVTTAVASVSVTPATASLTVGASQQLAATPKDASGNTLTGRTVTWSSSNVAVATVNASGLVTAVAAGTATITATCEGKTGAATITVGTGGGAIGSDQFVLIQPGSFQMGSTNGSNDEKPVHAVTITKAFYLMKTEVTQAQWKAVMDAMPSHFSSCGLDCPVESVNWNDIQTFLTRLNAANPGANYRLPTEAEWEYAARAGTATDFGGTNVMADMGWYNANAGLKTHPVAQKRANAWGLYDMHGNVFEWVQDWYGETYYGSSPASDPTGPATGTQKVLRGGAFDYGEYQARSAYRWTAAPGDRVGYYGFRLARTP